MTSNNLKQPKMTSKMKIINYGFMHIHLKLWIHMSKESSVWLSTDL